MRLGQRLLLLDGPRGRAATLAARLEEAGCACRRLDDAHELDAAVLGSRAEVVALDLDHPQATALARHLLAPDAQVATSVGLLAGSEADSVASMALALGADDLLGVDDPMPAVLSRIEVLGRAARVRRAVERLRAVLAEFGVRDAGGPAGLHGPPLHILVVGPSGSRVAALVPLLGGQARTTFADSLEAAEARLAETAFDAVLATTAEFVAPEWPPERLGQLPVLISAADGWPPARHLSNRGPVEVLHEPLPVEVVSLRLRLWTRQLVDRRWLRQAARGGAGRISNDHLTGVLAFGPAHEYLRRAMAAAPQERFALVVVDWTGVGPINRREGYAAGDRALIDFAEGVRGAVRAEDVPARLGAAAFAVVAAGLDQDAAEAFALRLLGAGWQAARAVGDERVARVGAVWPRADEAPAEAVQRARDACRTIYWDRLGGVERTTLLAAV